MYNIEKAKKGIKVRAILGIILMGIYLILIPLQYFVQYNVILYISYMKMIILGLLLLSYVNLTYFILKLSPNKDDIEEGFWFSTPE